MNRPGGHWQWWRRSVGHVHSKWGWGNIGGARGGIRKCRQWCRVGSGLIFAVLSGWPSTRSIEEAFELWASRRWGFSLTLEMLGFSWEWRVLQASPMSSVTLALRPFRRAPPAMREPNGEAARNFQIPIKVEITECHAKLVFTFYTHSSCTTHLEILHRPLL
jgi:hypothetical protein